MTVRVGMEASGHARWFERLLNELQIELWIGDAAAIRTKRVRKQKTDTSRMTTLRFSALICTQTNPFRQPRRNDLGREGFVGFGNSVYIIDPETESGSALRLGSYFANFYATEECLLVASGCGLLRFSPVGEVLWKTSGLALDDVVVKRVNEDRVTGEGEWDPSNGWRPFVLRLDSGERIVD